MISTRHGDRRIRLPEPLLVSKMIFPFNGFQILLFLVPSLRGEKVIDCGGPWNRPPIKILTTNTENPQDLPTRLLFPGDNVQIPTRPLFPWEERFRFWRQRKKKFPFCWEPEEAQKEAQNQISTFPPPRFGSCRSLQEKNPSSIICVVFTPFIP